MVDAFTFSAGVDIALTVLRLGATLVGVPPARAPNCFIDTMPYRLDHTGPHGTVSFRYSLPFPADPARGRVLTPHHAKEAGNDPDGTVRQALRHLARSA